MTSLKRYLAAIGVAIMAMIYALARARQSGKKAADLKTEREKVNAHETRDAIENTLDAGPAGGAASELRRDWQRK